jgi:MFS transporter, DHA2 family, glioxin efflux transporter
MISVLSATAPNIDPASVVATGATQLRSTFAPDEIPSILVAYMAGIKVALALSIGATGIALFAGLFCSWNRLPNNAAKATGELDLKRESLHDPVV